MVDVVIEPHETVTDALFRATKRAGIDPFDAEPSLYVQVDADALDRLLSTAGERAQDVSLAVDLWDRLYVFTPTTIEVYDLEDDSA